MMIQAIDTTMQGYVDNQEIAGGALIVRRDGEIIYKNKWGYADLASKSPIEYDSVFRMMSLTKVAVAVAVMKLIEEGKICLDAPLSEYIPAFSDMRVVSDPKYVMKEGENPAAILKNLLFFNKDKVKTVPADRQLTIRDLLSHSSGLEMGAYGLMRLLKYPVIRQSTAEVAEKYASYPLDFQPGTGTGYSGFASFDVLLRICEIVSGIEAHEFMSKTVFEPLGMSNSSFLLSPEQKERLVRLYKRAGNALKDVTGTKEDLDGFLHLAPGYPCGSGGLYSTVEDYDKLGNMLCSEGKVGGGAYLKPETVHLMAAEAPAMHLEPEPGYVWGLGVKIRQNKEKGGFAATEGTYGWSGAFGTHLFVSPKDRLECVFCSNRSDAGGSGFYISGKIEDMVFKTFVEGTAEGCQAYSHPEKP